MSVRLTAQRVLALLLLALLGCSAGTEHIAATQVTARILIAEEVLANMAQLRVRSFRQDAANFRFRAERSFDKKVLKAVVDVALIPSQAKEDSTVLVVVDALDKHGAALVQARATFNFVLHEQRVIELWLYRCGAMALGKLCSEADCQTAGCRTCVDDQCGATPFFEGEELTPLNPAVIVDPSKVPSAWPDAGLPDSGPGVGREAGALLDACSGTECAARADAATTNDSPRAEAGTLSADASASDASVATPSDAGSAPGFDAGGLDAGAHDSGTAAAVDAAVRDTGAAIQLPGRCADETAWSSATREGAIPAGARVLAQQLNGVPQYVCRIRAPDGSIVPAKISQDPVDASRFHFDCYGAYLAVGSSIWRELAAASQGDRFEVLISHSECVLNWIAVPAGSSLPERALRTGTSASGGPLYSCRIDVLNDAGVDETQIGRVAGTPGDLCRVQYYENVRERSSFEVLVQTLP